MADIKATTNFSNWDFKNLHVQQELEGDKFVTGGSTLICAAAPSLGAGATTSNGIISSSAATTNAFPIGVVISSGVQQNKQLQKIFEIGSARSYLIPGRTFGSVTLNRLYYHGPSLMKAMYHLRIAGGDADAASAGANEMMLNLSSNLFNKPIGLVFIFRDSKSENVGATYLENCYIQAHTFSVAAEAIVISEQVQCQFDRALPVALA